MDSRTVVIALLLSASFGLAVEPEFADKGHTLIYRAETPNTVWNGWGFASPANPDQAQESAAVPEQFDLVENTAESPRVFSGKVIGLESMDGVEVGLVSLVGVHWVNPATYQWVQVASDGSFSITDARFNDAAKALVVRGPNAAWTFLRYNFLPKQSGKNIVLKPAPSKKIRLTASGADMQNFAKVGYEIFPATAQVNDEGKSLRRQRLGNYNTGEATFVDAVMPLGPVALFINSPGRAGYYQIVDTRKADHFHFVLKSAGALKISLLDSEGKPKPGIHVGWCNPAAPLSLREGSTNEKGVLTANSLVPGTFIVNFERTSSRQIEVQEGNVTEVVMQDGKEPVITQEKIGASIPQSTGSSSLPH